MSLKNTNCCPNGRTFAAIEMNEATRRSIVVHPLVIAEKHRTQPGGCATLVNLNADRTVSCSGRSPPGRPSGTQPVNVKARPILF
ncbi:hypothetical protein ABZ619_09435 [Streptomyces sp. NPDC007851]|uniref:hypothetical protein n=1 Tax=Streptomyces sp. NPDC007851 TaxID=3155008 RepID=UPI0033C8DBE8